MKLVIIGGTGLIGSKLVTQLRDQGHEVVPASPDTGVNTVTGDGLAEAVRRASVVVDVSNSPSFEEKAVMDFFTCGSRKFELSGTLGVDHVIVCSERGLRHHLRRFVDYYHRSRTHLALQKDGPEPRAIHGPNVGRIVAFPEVGGLHHRYERRAA